MFLLFISSVWMSLSCISSCQNSFFLLCNQSIFFALTCQRHPSLATHKKMCLLHAFPLSSSFILAEGDLINPGKHSVLLHWFAAAERPRPHALIDRAASFRHRCQDWNIDCWLKPKSIKFTQAVAARPSSRGGHVTCHMKNWPGCIAVPLTILGPACVL